jgi:CheY-like chemotaxis protein
MPRADILVVDDDPDILELATSFLREAGHAVTPAPHGDAALACLEREPAFRLLITDIVLPGRLDGFALAHKAREIIPHIRVIYATGFAGVARVRSVGAPPGDMLQKPWRCADLLQRVDKILRDPLPV